MPWKSVARHRSGHLVDQDPPPSGKGEGPALEELPNSLDDFTNPFLDPSSHQHVMNQDALFQTIQPNHSYSIFPDLPIFNSNSEPRFSFDTSISTETTNSSSIFSRLYSQDSISPSSRLLDATFSVSSPSAIWSQSTHHTAFTTPNFPPARVTSPTFGSSCKLLDKTPLFPLDTTPFKLFKAPELPPLLDLQGSPVVRRSLGDVTPVYRCRSNVSDDVNNDQAPCGFFREALRLADEETSGNLRSPCPSWRNSSTSFLQKLSRQSGSPQKRTLPYPSGNAMLIQPTLASPFLVKPSTSERVSSAQPSASIPSPAKDFSPPEFEVDSPTNCARAGFSAEQRNYVNIFSSPLSELSTSSPSTSPLPFSLKEMFEDEDRKYRMRTRSTARLEKPNKSYTPTPRKHSLKRKSTDSETEDFAGNAEIPSSAKRGKFADDLKIRIPPLKSTRWILSNGAGPVTFSSKARSKSSALASTLDAYSEAIPSLPQVHFNDSQVPLTEADLQRKFPPSIPINETFPRFYRKFPVSSFFSPEGTNQSVLIDGNKPAALGGHARTNIPRGGHDLYTPRFTKGIGHHKQGLCPICFEAVERGGAGVQEWFSLKFSAYKCYHMQYFHGISPTTGKPFSPPIDFRTQSRPQARKLEKTEVLEGKCHKCRQWIPIEGVKIGTVNVKELFWWKHAAICHKASRLPGDEGIFLEDDIFRRLQNYEDMAKERVIEAEEDE